MQNRLKSFFLSVFIIGAYLFTGCTTAPAKTIIDTASLKVVTEGRKTIVYDIIGDKEYYYTIKSVKATEVRTEPKTVVKNDTIVITLRPNKEIEIIDRTSRTKYTIHRGRS